jgi:hypothetical protein
MTTNTEIFNVISLLCNNIFKIYNPFPHDIIILLWNNKMELTIIKIINFKTDFVETNDFMSQNLPEFIK